MKTKRCLFPSAGVLPAILAAVIFGIINGFCAAPATADDGSDARQLVERARMTLENFMQAPETEGFRRLAKDARGVFIAPQVLRGAFIFGASGGSGVFFARDIQTNSWGGPAFYTIGGASFGFQIGGDASEVIFLAMTDRGVGALLRSSVKLGADAGVAVGPIGAGVDASTANLSADILTFSRSKGLYGGISLEGAVVAVRERLNNAYHGLNVSPTDILVTKVVTNPHSAGLVEVLSKAAGGSSRRPVELPR